MEADFFHTDEEGIRKLYKVTQTVCKATTDQGILCEKAKDCKDRDYSKISGIY